MKKFLVTLLAAAGISLASFAQQAQPAPRKKAAPVAAAAKPRKALNATAVTPVKAAGPVKKDGTPDKRFKANKKLKKDGTPDKRYKENKN